MIRTIFLNQSIPSNNVPKKSLYVVKLSEVESGKSKEKLPSLCKLVCDEDKRKRCFGIIRKIAHKVDLATSKEVCAACCNSGAKIIPFSGKDDTGKDCIWIAFTRSPFAHGRFLKEVAKEAEVSYEDFRDAFFALPPFSLHYVKRVLRFLRKRNVLIASDIRYRLKRLGEGYSQYSEDMIEYDTIYYLTKKLKGKSKAINVQVSSKSWKKDIPIIRILNAQPDLSLAEQEGLPTIGYSPESSDEPFEHPFVENVEKAYEEIMSIKWQELWPKAYIEDNLFKDRPERKDTKILVGLKEEQTFQPDIYREDVKFILNSIDLGKGGHCDRLVAHLEKPTLDKSGLEDFKLELSDYVHCLGETFGEKAEDLDNLHHQVLDDIQFVVKDKALVLDYSESFRGVVRDILVYLAKHSVFMPAREMPDKKEKKVFTKKRRDVLRNDLLENRSDYLENLKNDIIFVEATLHELWAPECRKMILAIFSDFTGVVTKWLLFGLVYAHDVGGYFRGRGYHKYVNKRFYFRLAVSQ